MTMIIVYIIAMLLALPATIDSRRSKVCYPVMPSTKFVLSNTPMQKSIASRTNAPEQIALDFVQEQLGLSKDDVVVKNIVPTAATGVTSVYLRQLFNGIEVANADININIKDGQIISYGENIYRAERSSRSRLAKASVLKNLRKTPEEAFASLTTFLELPKTRKPWKVRQAKDSIEVAAWNNKPAYVVHDYANAKREVPVRFSYLQTDKGSRLKLVYSHELRLESNWYHAHVNTETAEVEALIDWVSNATYTALDIQAVDIGQNERRLLEEPSATDASPGGWHSSGGTLYRDTRGNNVWAQQNRFEDTDLRYLYRPSGDYKMDFTFPFDSTKEPRANRDAAITQLFYTVNVLHDILHKYGFDEVAGNFQGDNGNKGGEGGDFVIANGLDETSYNNANFGTPPDGQNGVMNMFLFYVTTPAKDGIFELGIVIHEYGHGLSNRLTGGPANSGCLNMLQSGGMGEGWSDVLATVLRQKPENKRTDEFPVGLYAAGRGIRLYPYSTDLTINPSLYSYIDRQEYAEVHNIGEVWAVILLEVYWNLIDLLPFTSDLYSASTTNANTLFLQLMINGMKLQPCNPTFIQARDAFLQAEVLLTNGAHACAIWKGFAKRGLGYNAQRVADVAQDGFDLPPTCP